MNNLRLGSRLAANERMEELEPPPASASTTASLKLFALTRSEIHARLIKREIGSYLMWTEPVTCEELTQALLSFPVTSSGSMRDIQLPRYLNVSIRFFSDVYHFALPHFHVIMRCTLSNQNCIELFQRNEKAHQLREKGSGSKPPGMQVLKVSREVLSKVSSFTQYFMTSFIRLLSNIIADPNFISLPLVNEQEITSELRFHKYIVFPSSPEHCITQFTIATLSDVTGHYRETMNSSPGNASSALGAFLQAIDDSSDRRRPGSPNTHSASSGSSGRSSADGSGYGYGDDYADRENISGLEEDGTFGNEEGETIDLSDCTGDEFVRESTMHMETMESTETVRADMHPHLYIVRIDVLVENEQILLSLPPQSSLSPRDRCFDGYEEEDELSHQGDTLDYEEMENGFNPSVSTTNVGCGTPLVSIPLSSFQDAIALLLSEDFPQNIISMANSRNTPGSLDSDTVVKAVEAVCSAKNSENQLLLTDSTVKDIVTIVHSPMLANCLLQNGVIPVLIETVCNSEAASVISNAESILAELSDEVPDVSRQICEYAFHHIQQHFPCLRVMALLLRMCNHHGFVRLASTTYDLYVALQEIQIASLVSAFPGKSFFKMDQDFARLKWKNVRPDGEGAFPISISKKGTVIPRVDGSYMTPKKRTAMGNLIYFARNSGIFEVSRSIFHISQLHNHILRMQATSSMVPPSSVAPSAPGSGTSTLAACSSYSSLADFESRDTGHVTTIKQLQKQRRYHQNSLDRTWRELQQLKKSDALVLFRTMFYRAVLRIRSLAPLVEINNGATIVDMMLSYSDEKYRNNPEFLGALWQVIQRCPPGQERVDSTRYLFNIITRLEHAVNNDNVECVNMCLEMASAFLRHDNLHTSSLIYSSVYLPIIFLVKQWLFLRTDENNVLEALSVSHNIFFFCKSFLHHVTYHPVLWAMYVFFTGGDAEWTMTRFVLHHCFDPKTAAKYDALPSGRQHLNSLRHGTLDVLFLIVHLTEIFHKVISRGINHQVLPLPSQYKTHMEFIQQNERQIMYLFNHEMFFEDGMVLTVLNYEDRSEEFDAIRRHVLRLSERILRSDLFPLPTTPEMIVFKVRVLYSCFVKRFCRRSFSIQNIQFCVDCLRDVVVTANTCKGKTHRGDDIIFRMIKSLTSMLSLEYLINDDSMQFFAESNYADAPGTAPETEKSAINGDTIRESGMDYLVSRVSGYLFSHKVNPQSPKGTGAFSRGRGDLSARQRLSPRPVYSTDDFGVGDPTLIGPDNTDNENALGKVKTDGIIDSEEAVKRQQEREKELLYSRQRATFKVYANDGLHRTLIMALLSLLVNDKGLLYFDHQLCAQTFLVLRAHFDHPANYALVPRLLEQTLMWAPAACPLLRFMCRGMFDQNLYDIPRVLEEHPRPSCYTSTVKLAPDYNPEYDGFEVDETKVCIKIQDLRDHAKISGRIAALLRCVVANNKLKREPRALYVYDYGTTATAGWMVSQAHCGNLLDWRLAQKLPLTEELPLYLQIYRDILEACRLLPEHGINHLNISCFAFVCRPHNFHETRNSLNEADYTGKRFPEFTPVLSHFQHSVFRDSPITNKASKEWMQASSFTDMRPSSPRMPSESTVYKEFVSPEVLQSTGRVEYDERHDVWSIGCLLFELLCAHPLFKKDNPAVFAARLTQDTQPILLPEDEEELLHMTPLIDFLKAVLVRDINKRPTVEQTLELFNKASCEVLGLTEPLSPTPLPFSGTSSATDYSGAHGSSVSASKAKRHAAPASHSARMLSDVTTSLVYISLPSVLAESLLRVRKSLYVGGPKCLRNRHELINHYHLTHVIDFTNSEDVLASMFTVMSINTTVTPLAALPQLLDQIVSFARAAFLRNGRVLILSPLTRSIGIATAVALLIALQNMTAYEACLFIRHRSYSLSIQQPIISALRQMSLRYRSYRGLSLCVPGAWTLVPATRFRCFCGNFSVSLRAPAHVYECTCTHEHPDPLCPTMFSGASCSDFREYCGRKYWWNFPSVKWVYVDRSQIRFDQARMDWMTTDLRTAFSLPLPPSSTTTVMSTESGENVSPRASSAPTSENDRHYIDVNYRDEKKSGWRIFVCRLCKCICYAVRKIPAATLNEVPLHIRKQYAVCANIDCGTYGFVSRLPSSPEFIEPFLINDGESHVIVDV